MQVLNINTTTVLPHGIHQSSSATEQVNSPSVRSLNGIQSDSLISTINNDGTPEDLPPSYEDCIRNAPAVLVKRDSHPSASMVTGNLLLKTPIETLIDCTTHVKCLKPLH
ncbi:hypothetical protein Bhyg_02598, partial [Pseudolycoriella hygida]